MNGALVSLIAFTASGALFALVERVLPASAPRSLGRSVVTDLAHAVFSNAAPSAAVALLAAALPSQGLLAGTPGWAQWLVVLAVTELSFYAVHRAMHRVAWLWRIHAIHHSPRDMDWLAGYRKSVAEQLLHALMPLPLLVVLGPSPEVLLAHSAFGIAMTGFTHWNTRLPLDWLSAVIVTPRYHAWHHAAEPAPQRRNLAGKLTVLDLVFRTRHRAPARPPRLGLGDEDPAMPDGWIGQQLSTFRAQARPQPQTRST